MKFILLDGNSFCYRAFYAVRDLRTAKNEPTNAVFGFITMLDKVIKDVDPDGVAVTFDMRGPTFRHKKYEDYKIQRPPMPEDLAAQIPVIKEVIEAMNIPIFQMEGYEADDILATLAKKLEKAGHETYLVTGDKDMLQLVTKKIKVLNPQKDNFIYDEAAVKQRFGVGPNRVVEIMALMGDASDNIPGVPGIGDKTASKLIVEYGTLENVLKNISNIKGDKLKENLQTYKEQAHLSRELATIVDDVPVLWDIEKLKRPQPNVKKLTELYRRLEFRLFLKNLGAEEIKHADDTNLRYHLIEKKKDFEELKKKLAKEKRWAFDFETTGVDPLTAEPVGISFSFRDKEAWYVAFSHGKGDLFSELDTNKPGASHKSEISAKEALLSLQDFFENPKIQKVGQNIKYEAMILKNFGIELQGIYFDTMVASYCLNPGKPNHNLDDIAMEHLSARITSIKELIGTGRNQISMAEVEIDKLFRYGCQDSDVTRRLSVILEEKLLEHDVLELFEKIEMPLVHVLADMEYKGIAIDAKLLGEFSREMEKSLAALTKDIHRLAGGEFNINSPKQLGEILFEKLALPVVKKTKTGASTDVDVLQELSEVHPLPKEILKFRELSKLKSTYVDALPLLANPRDHRVHTSYNQTVTSTGRLSSSDPNLQNIPIRTEEGRKIRRAFVADGKDKILVSADYSQIELRVLAHLSQDGNLIKAFREGADIHRYTAGLIYNTPMKDVTDSMRSSAKTVNFGILYGMGAFSLAKNLGITNDSAKDFIKAYFERYPKVKVYLDGTLEKARKDGFVSTYFKRRRYIPEILSHDVRMKSFAERTAINMPIQGTASDIIKIAMREIASRTEKEKYEARMILQVHDELVFEVPKKELKELVFMVKKEMQGAVSFDVPMSVSVKAGPNWLDMESVD